MEAPMKLDAAIHQRLGRLRLTLRLAALFQGASRVLVLLALAVVASLAVDYGSYLVTLQHMTVAQRLLVALIALGVLGAAAWKRMVKPALVKITPEDLVLIVERRYPELSDRLISALQLSQMAQPERMGISAELLGLLMQQANQAARALSFGAVLRKDAILKSAGWVAAAVLALAGLGAWRSDLFSLWFQRNVLLADARWPRETYLTVEGGPQFKVARGEPLIVRVCADPAHFVPQQVKLHMRFSTANEVEEVVDRSVDLSPTFIKKFDAVTERFRFYVTGNDDRTPECYVDIAEPPQLAEAGITIEKPAYMREPPTTVPGSAGTINVPLGSTLLVRGRATKDLAGAAILLDGVEAARCEVRQAAENGSAEQRPRGLAARVRLEAERNFRPSREMRITLTDKEGYTNSRAAQYRLAVLPDRPPQVQISTKGVGSAITAKARIPFGVESQDDHGLRTYVLEWSVVSTNEKPVRDTILELEPPAKEKRFEHALDLEPLSRGKATEQALFNLGDSLRLLVRVQDSLPGPEGPNETLSNPLTFKITSEDDLLSTLSETQRAAQEQFRQVILIQSEALERSAGALDARDPDETRRLVNEAANLQQQIGDRVTAIGGRFVEVLERMQNNRIGNDQDKFNLRSKVIEPLRSLADVALRSISSDLVAARENTDALKIRKLLPGIIEEQRKAQARMEAILSDMIRIENAQQVEREWRAIIEMGQKVKNILETERRIGEPKTPEEKQGEHEKKEPVE